MILLWILSYLMIGFAAMVLHDYYYKEFRDVSWSLLLVWPVYAGIWILTGVGLLAMAVWYGVILIQTLYKKKEKE